MTTSLFADVPNSLLNVRVRSICDKYNLDPIMHNKMYIDRSFFMLMRIGHIQSSNLTSIFSMSSSPCNKLIHDAFIACTTHNLERLIHILQTVIRQHRRQFYDDCIIFPMPILRLLDTNLKVVQILRLRIREVNSPRCLFKESMRTYVDVCMRRPYMLANMYSGMPTSVWEEIDEQLLSNRRYDIMCDEIDANDVIRALVTDPRTVVCNSVKRKIMAYVIPE